MLGIQCNPPEHSRETHFCLKDKINFFNLVITKDIKKANFAMIADLESGLTILDLKTT